MFADDRFVGLDWWRAHGLRAFHGIPILVRGTLLGILGIHGAQLLAEDGEERDLLETFVAQAAIALENARLFSETTRRLEETRALLDLAAILNSSLDARQVLKQVARRTAQVCRVDRCSVERRDGDRLVPLVSQFAESQTRMPAVWSAYTALRQRTSGMRRSPRPSTRNSPW